MVGHRTLSDTGGKETLSLVQSMNSSTHSYTIQPPLSNSGELAPKLYICFQEKGGKLGPLVQKRLDQNLPPNIVVDASKSGKLTKVNLKRWINSCFKDSVEEETLLLQDSWTGQRDHVLFSESIGNSSLLTIKTLPPKTTKYIQPLDVYFFRQYKSLARRFQENVRLIAPSTAQQRLNDRVVIMLMHSFIYNQLSHEDYKAMRMYSWQKSGYSMDVEIETFSNVWLSNFDFIYQPCSASDCERGGFIKCMYCESVFCSEHCMKPLHLH